MISEKRKTAICKWGQSAVFAKNGFGKVSTQYFIVFSFYKKKKHVLGDTSDEEYEKAFEEEMKKEEARLLRKDLEDEEEMDDDEIQDMLKQNMKFNIILF